MIQGFLVNPVEGSKKGSKRMARRRTRSKARRTPARRRKTTTRRRRTTRKGMKTLSGRRAYQSRARSNPARRRRRRSAAKKNPLGDLMMSLLVGGGVAAVAAALNQKILISGPAKARYEVQKKNPEATKDELIAASAIPPAIQGGWGQVMTNVGLGLAIGIAMDTMGKKGGIVQQNAAPVALGFVSYAAALAVHDTIRKSEKKEDWYRSGVAHDYFENQREAEQTASTAGLGSLVNARNAQQLAMHDLQSGISSMGRLTNGRLPFGNNYVNS